jgi:Fe2+ transport system protein FeoA
VTLTRAQRGRLESEIVDVRLALLDESMPDARRMRLRAELTELRLARAGVEGIHTRARLLSLGILTGESVHRRGPAEWGEATRVSV